MNRDQVARHQKARLEGAMVEAVARHGFASTTIRELVTLAGVSKSTFYEHFEGKEDCFLSTFDAIMAQLTQEVGEAYEGAGDARERLLRALDRFTAIVDERPEAVAFVTVDSLTLGAAAVARREKAWEAFEAVARRHLSPAGAGAEVSELTVRAVVAGTTGVIYRCLRAGRSEDLQGLVEPLIDWAFSYRQPDSEAVRAAVAAAERPSAPLPVRDSTAVLPAWEEPPDSPRSRSQLSQQERIIRAAIRVVVERGYEALSIPAISATAGTSNQTFYENFKSKRDAFLAGYESVSAGALGQTSAALERAEDGPEAVGLALRALSECIAANELYARLAFFELAAAGPPALDRADETMDLLVSILERAKGEGEREEPLPHVVLEATAAGIWSVIQREIAHDRRHSLPEVAGELARIAVAPLGGG
ncbi:MAG TPA: TetR/AcrR family transcriptional regulator [Solirubrobacterales bacterium]|jgi:AcrR family transcriptional regulator|nr:TetR/AcrR family transcriptional regulator [Solirubrobacterales bacterium]